MTLLLLAAALYAFTQKTKKTPAAQSTTQAEQSGPPVTTGPPAPERARVDALLSKGQLTDDQVMQIAAEAGVQVDVMGPMLGTSDTRWVSLYVRDTDLDAAVWRLVRTGEFYEIRLNGNVRWTSLVS